MKNFTIFYEEVYGRYYTVEAENERDAKEMIIERIRAGKLDGPEECIMTHVTVDEN